MSNKNVLLLVLWNLLLTGVLGWSLMRKPAAVNTVAPALETASSNADTLVVNNLPPKDTAALKNAPIAFFHMDSIQAQYDLVKESANRVRSEGQRLEGNLAREMEKAENRAKELATKDHTYSTQAEQQADEREFQGLQERIQELRAKSQEQIDEMQMRALQQITQELQSFLEEYNRTAHFDYIIAVQEGGQVWVGNKGLDITSDVVAGLNARHRAKKAAAPAPVK
jgi:Skp family chaperone for outer membrane proteins